MDDLTDDGMRVASEAAPEAESTGKDLPNIDVDELREHNNEDSAWVAIGGKVYDLTDFLEDHPAGPKSILDTAGADGTDSFKKCPIAMLEEFEPIGLLL